MIRLFVGIGLPPEVKLRLSLICSGVPGARWVDPGNFHVTLRFIGEVDEGVAADIDEALLKLRAPRFKLQLAGTGHFGAKMLWVGVEKTPELVRLHEKIETAMVRLGLPPETRRYAPHVTLARFNKDPGPKLAEYLADHALFREAPLAVDHFSLIASYLTKSGSIYEDQADYPLE